MTFNTNLMMTSDGAQNPNRSTKKFVHWKTVDEVSLWLVVTLLAS